MNYTKGVNGGARLFYGTAGRVFEVIAVRESDRDANRVIEKAGERLGVIATIGNDVLLARMDDDGVPVERLEGGNR